MSSDDFKLITYKNPKIPKVKLPPQYYVEEATLDSGTVINRIEDAKKEILTSNLYESVLASLREGFVQLNRPLVKEIVCFGLGQISNWLMTRYQFAFLLCLKDSYNIERVYCYDPLFTELDCSIIKHYNLQLLQDNCEAKYRANDEFTTIFFLPHCSKQLINNLLWANWGLNLTKCVIITNSFNAIVEITPKKTLDVDAQYIQKILPYVLELAIINSFRLFQVFNDLAIHIFNLDQIKLISQDFWQYCNEPEYPINTTEFIRKGHHSQ